MITALIPCRGGSTRVKDKNIRPFANTTLLENKINICMSLKSEGLVDRILVNSDSEAILSVAKKYPVDIHRRDDYYASSACPAYEYFEHIANCTNTKHVLLCQVTCPLISIKTYRNAIKKYFDIINGDEYDSVVSTHPVKCHMWMNNRPLNYILNESPNSQDLPNIQRITYGINIINKELMIENRNAIGKKPYMLYLDEHESIDIDTHFDFEFAEYAFIKRIVSYNLDHISYICSDVDEAYKFHNSIFGMYKIDRPEGLPSHGYHISNGIITIHLIEDKYMKKIEYDENDVPHINHVCFCIDNIKKLENVDKYDTKIIKINGEDRLFIFDPDNYAFEIVEKSTS